MRGRPDFLRGERGFTLAELLVVCAVIAFMMAGLLSMMQGGLQSYLVGSNRVEATQSNRLVIAQMVQDLRHAGYCPTCSGASPFTAITSPSAGGFTTQNDWDGGGTISTSGTVIDANGNTRGEQIIYAFASGSLTRQEVGVDATALTLATGIDSLTFTYQDSTGATTAAAADVRTVVVSLTTQPENQPAATQHGRVLVTMTDSVRLRNR